MSLTINLAKYDGVDNKLIKDTGTVVWTGECILKNETSDRTPSFLLNIPLSTVSSCNYCSVDDLGYFFITDRIVIRNNLIEIKCKLDPLMTYQKDILKATGILERSNSAYNLYMQDPFITCLGYLSTDYYNKNMSPKDSKTHFIGIIAGE